MPNQEKTPRRSFRSPDELWLAAKEKAAQRGETMTDVLNRALEDYIGGGVNGWPGRPMDIGGGRTDPVPDGYAEIVNDPTAHPSHVEDGPGYLRPETCPACGQALELIRADLTR